MIRTLDPHVPNVVRYQTALHSVTSGARIDDRFLLHKLSVTIFLKFRSQDSRRGNGCPHVRADYSAATDRPTPK